MFCSEIANRRSGERLSQFQKSIIHKEIKSQEKEKRKENIPLESTIDVSNSVLIYKKRKFS